MSGQDKAASERMKQNVADLDEALLDVGNSVSLLDLCEKLSVTRDSRGGDASLGWYSPYFSGAIERAARRLGDEAISRLERIRNDLAELVQPQGGETDE